MIEEKSTSYKLAPAGAWDNTHTASLEDYQIDERVTSIYHPSVEQ